MVLLSPCLTSNKYIPFTYFSPIQITCSGVTFKCCTFLPSLLYTDTSTCSLLSDCICSANDEVVGLGVSLAFNFITFASLVEIPLAIIAVGQTSTVFNFTLNEHIVLLPEGSLAV